MNNSEKKINLKKFLVISFLIVFVIIVLVAFLIDGGMVNHWINSNGGYAAWIQAVGSLLIIFATVLPWQLDRYDKIRSRSKQASNDLVLMKIYFLEHQGLRSSIEVFMMRLNFVSKQLDALAKNNPGWGFYNIWLYKKLEASVHEMLINAKKINLYRDKESIPESFLEKLLEFKFCIDKLDSFWNAIDEGQDEIKKKYRFRPAEVIQKEDTDAVDDLNSFAEFVLGNSRSHFDALEEINDWLDQLFNNRKLI